METVRVSGKLRKLLVANLRVRSVKFQVYLKLTCTMMCLYFRIFFVGRFLIEFNKRLFSELLISSSYFRSLLL